MLVSSGIAVSIILVLDTWKLELELGLLGTCDKTTYGSVWFVEIGIIDLA